MPHFYSPIQKVSFIILSFFFAYSVSAQPPTISYAVEIPNLTVPINIAHAGDGTNRLFVLQQDGIIMVRDAANFTQFANFGTTGANIVLYGGEQGLLSMAFHPQYDGVNNRYFYLYHNDLNGDIAITRCQTTLGNVNTADVSTITNIITVPHPVNGNHNGGQVRFGPDGYLYFATGDGGGGNDVPNNAQTGNVLLGKMIRIDVDHTSGIKNYAIPPDNPYINDPAFDSTVYDLGLRNPYRWSFDRLTGDMWIGDVGQNAREEIDFRPAANTGHNNFGWRCFEGHISTPNVTDCTPVDYIPPVFDYPNPDSGRAVTCGFVYRGTEFPTLYGRFIATDVFTGYTWILSPNGSGGFDSTAQPPPNATTIVAFGEGEDGTLYAVSQSSNTLYKVIATGGTVIPVKIISFTGIAKTGFNELKWNTGTELNTARFNIEFSKDGNSFSRAGSIAATRNINGSNYNFRHDVDNKNNLFYRLATVDDDGSIAYSQVIRLKGIYNDIRIYPSIVNNNIINVELNGRSITTLRMINSLGKVVFKKDMKNAMNTVPVSLPVLVKGMYIVEVEGNDFLQTEKIFIQ